jgi:hypothetical protein
MDADHLHAAGWPLVEEAVDAVMVALDLVPVLVCAHHDGPVTLRVADRLGVLYGRCTVHGAALTAFALLDGRPVQLGHVTDADDLAAAIVGCPALDSLDADRLLADLHHARVDP